MFQFPTDAAPVSLETIPTILAMGWFAMVWFGLLWFGVVWFNNNNNNNNNKLILILRTFHDVKTV